eukprot:tig00021015_g17165.t1
MDRLKYYRSADILDLQKMEAGLIELSCVPVDVRSTVVNAVRIVKRRADEKTTETAPAALFLSCEPALNPVPPQGLAVSMDAAEDVPVLLLSDPDRLRQVLLNLLSNAVKYTIEGSVAVRVGVPGRPATPISGSGGAGALSLRRASIGAGNRIVLRFEVTDTGARGRSLISSLPFF